MPRPLPPQEPGRAGKSLLPIYGLLAAALLAALALALLIVLPFHRRLH
jgi:hypothetical protein